MSKIRDWEFVQFIMGQGDEDLTVSDHLQSAFIGGLGTMATGSLSLLFAKAASENPEAAVLALVETGITLLAGKRTIHDIWQSIKKLSGREQGITPLPT